MTFRLSPSSLSSASFVAAVALALAACSGEIAGTPNYGGSGGGSGGGGHGPPGTCAGACMRIYQLPCASTSTQTEAQCEQGCDTALTQAQQIGCASQFTAALGCYQSGSITCGAQGNADTSACSAQIMAVDKCANPPPPGCEAIPYPASGVTNCTTFVSGGGPDAGAGPNMESCNDGKGNTWTSTCSATSCSCNYNGTTSCSCVLTGGKTICCPGI